ncbi:MAG: PIN domain-containing protein [Saprospirales bacterium]|nr:PIN domain-containing protein [Saprospirales bacterium]
MEKVFVDTNIFLDWLGGREPFYAYAKELFKKAERKEITVLLSTMTYITVAYILRKEIGSEKVRKALAGIRTITHVCESGAREIDLALLSDIKDFEDAFHYYTATHNQASVLITRNVKDFKHAGLPVMTAEEYLKSTQT